MARVNGGVKAGGFGTATLKMFTITPQDGSNTAVDLSGDVGSPDTALEAVVQTIQTKATTFLIGAVGATTFRVACEPSAWTAADLQTAIRALGTVNGFSLASATVSNNGFKLA